MKINEEWHKKNKMAKSPSIEERVDWHIKHAKYCKCREIPANLVQVIESFR